MASDRSFLRERRAPTGTWDALRSQPRGHRAKVPGAEDTGVARSAEGMPRLNPGAPPADRATSLGDRLRRRGRGAVARHTWVCRAAGAGQSTALRVRAAAAEAQGCCAVWLQLVRLRVIRSRARRRHDSPTLLRREHGRRHRPSPARRRGRSASAGEVRGEAWQRAAERRLGATSLLSAVLPRHPRKPGVPCRVPGMQPAPSREDTVTEQRSREQRR